MNETLEKKLDVKDKIKSFLNRNKLKFILFIIVIFCSVLVFFFQSENHKRKTLLISEKYISAGFLLSNGKKEEAKDYYEEIILSKNKFYSLLALNTVLEKELINDKIKIIKYFNILEKNNSSEDYFDLILFKKALFLLKIGDLSDGKEILNNLIDNNSKLKLLAEEIILK